MNCPFPSITSSSLQSYHHIICFSPVFLYFLVFKPIFVHIPLHILFTLFTFFLLHTSSSTFYSPPIHQSSGDEKDIVKFLAGWDGLDAMSHAPCSLSKSCLWCDFTNQIFHEGCPHNVPIPRNGRVHLMSLVLYFSRVVFIFPL